MDFLSPDIAQMDLVKYMREALNEAMLAGMAQELPLGAVLVVDGEIIGRGRARHQECRNELSHAELNAILDGGERLWRNYPQAALFSTVEPCPMCLGAITMAGIPHVIFALHDKVVFSRQTIEANPYIRRRIRSYYGGVLEDDSTAMFLKFAPQYLNRILNGNAAHGHGGSE